MRPTRMIAAFALAVAPLAAPDAFASGDRIAPTRFDDMVRARAGGVVSVAPIEPVRLPPDDPLRLKWEAFRTRHRGRWNVYVDERSGMPTLVAGPGIDLFAGETVLVPNPSEIELRVRRFLRENDLLPAGRNAEISLDPDATREIRKGYWQLVFRQAVDGVRVENSRLDVHVVDGSVTMFGSSHWGRVDTRGIPDIDARGARGSLDTYLGVRTEEYEGVGEPELVLMAIDPDLTTGHARKWSGERGAGLSHALAWRLRFQDPDTPAIWVAEIDAQTGSVRAFYDGAHYAAVRGGVYPIAPEVGCTSGGCEIDGFPMPFADWTENGQPRLTTDSYGHLACSDPQASFETHLAGPYAVVQDACGPFVERSGCDGEMQLGVKAGENCDVAPGSSPGNTAAARSAYYHVNRVNEVARSYLPGLSWLSRPVSIVSNWNATCNAAYGTDALYLYRSGTSWAPCANTGEIEGIVVHEWGHGLDFNDGGGADNTSEAYADVVAMLASRQSCFGPGLFADGSVCSGYGDTCLTCTGFRDHDWAARQANTPATPQDFVQNLCSTGSGPCGRGVHCETYPIDEAIYDLATRDLPASGMDVDSAWQLVERLWYSTRSGSGGDIYTCALPLSDSCSATSWYQRLRGADDDDGNLSNGTPHAAALYAAFARHNIACGASGDPENQSTSGCSALARPAVTIHQVASGPELQWGSIAGASQYVIYRGDLGCSHQQVAVATLDAGVTAWVDGLPDPDLPRYYRVEAVGTNTVCRSPVSNCEMTSAGPRLQKNGHRWIEDGPNVNGSGFPDPGETFKMPVTLFNGGTADALGVVGRVRTVDPTQGRVVRPLVPYPDIPVSDSFESVDPHFQLTLFESGAMCGTKVPLEIEMLADNAPMRSRQFDLVLGDRSRDFANSGSVSIPRLTTVPVTSTVTIDQDQTIADLDVSVSITHGNAAELIVELTSPTGIKVRLHDHSSGVGINTRYDLETQPDGPGSMADFNGQSTLGTWTLSVQDTIWGVAPGTFGGFTLHVTVAGGFDCSVLTCPEPTPANPPGNLLVDKTPGAGGATDLLFSWSGVVGAAGYHVLHSPVPTFDGRVDLTGRTTGETTVHVENGAASTPSLTYFQVRAINGCNEESP